MQKEFKGGKKRNKAGDIKSRISLKSFNKRLSMSGDEIH